MKKLFSVIVALVAFGSAYAQWTNTSNGIKYSSNVGIGVSSLTGEDELRIDRSSANSGWNRGINVSLGTNFGSFHGTVTSYSGIIGRYSGSSKAAGATGITRVGRLHKGHPASAYAYGANYAVIFEDAALSNSYANDGNYHMSGVRASIDGTIASGANSIGNNGVISALIAEDNIGTSKSMAGYFKGKVGIGTKRPGSNLHVNGNIQTNSNLIFLKKNNDANDGMGIKKTNNAHMTLYSDGVISFQESDNNDTKVSFDLNNGLFKFEGKIEAKEIECKNVGADYVFADDYQLRSLAEVEKFVTDHDHLPGIAPASETEKGINVGEFTEKLLEKIEELTLYTIAQEKRINKLESQLNAQ